MKLDKSGLRRIIKQEIASARQEAALRPTSKLSMTRIREIILEEVAAVKKQRLTESAQGMRRTGKMSLVEALLGEADDGKGDKKENPVATAADLKKALHDSTAKWNVDYAKSIPRVFVRAVKEEPWLQALINKGPNPSYDDIIDYLVKEINGSTPKQMVANFEKRILNATGDRTLDDQVISHAMPGLYAKYPHVQIVHR